MPHLNAIPLGSLRAVEVVARNGSLRAAADELGVTPGAVSQQVARAEAALGRALFTRHVTGMSLTEFGAEVAPLLQSGFAQLAEAVRRAAPRRDDSLTISVAPIFASRWLIWELPDFHASAPGIRVRLDSEVGLVDPGRSDVDVSLRVGRGDYPGVRAERLFPHRAMAVCTPDLAARIRSPADLAHVPVIRESRSMFGWDIWLRPLGLTIDNLGDGPVFSDASLCLDAAISGAGVFMAFEVVAHHALRHGQLVALPPGEIETGLAYWLITAENRSPGPALTAFRRWLKARLVASGFAR
jgi:LysR family glycine cleavage system transcriptional activator